MAVSDTTIALITVALSALGGTTLGLVAEPVRSYFQQRYKRQNLKLALYGEIISRTRQLVNSIAELLDMHENFSKDIPLYGFEQISKEADSLPDDALKSIDDTLKSISKTYVDLMNTAYLALKSFKEYIAEKDFNAYELAKKRPTDVLPVNRRHIRN